MLLFPELNIARPFLKWAGGKKQLIADIKISLPVGIAKKNNLTYIEPFVGSGAVMFWFLKEYSNVSNAIINDINPDLTTAYEVIKKEPDNLIRILSQFEKEYYSIKTELERQTLFLEKRAIFNLRNHSSLENTALLIFLNKTCFNGLYRVNSKNNFNVPFGKYDKPKICDANNIIADSQLLQKVTILNGDYESTLKHATQDSFFYFDPPYKPISKTSSSNAYSAECFDDVQQERLAKFCENLNNLGHSWLLSNSDLK
ncbi:MAG: Dam family site-specific DNA-(adenine-N6)-methyltransferase, partial [Bacteroidetes bacterium]|nr:Dam family site-specific DNA-(adenine-N6)-methyltransferase [Bacteroidota bacterium]